MFEIAGIVFMVVSVVDIYMKTGNQIPHFAVGLLLIVTSMAIKSHSELVQIKKYIGDGKRKEPNKWKKETDDVTVNED